MIIFEVNSAAPNRYPVAAINIVTPKGLNIVQESPEQSPPKKIKMVLLKDGLDLDADDDIKLELKVINDYDSEDEAIEQYNKMTSVDYEGFLYGFGIDYGNQLNPKLRYRTKFLDRVLPDQVQPLHYDIIELPYSIPVDFKNTTNGKSKKQ